MIRFRYIIPRKEFCAVGIYVAVMYLLCAFRGEQRSYSVMMNLSLAFGLFSGIVFIETDKAKRWFVPAFLGALWVAGVVVEGVMWENHVQRDLYYLLFFFVPILIVWALSKIRKGRNVIQAFVGAVFSLFSLGFLPGRGRLEPLYDILLVVIPMMTYTKVAKNQSQRQRWFSLLMFLVVYSYVIIANPYNNLAMFIIVTAALLMVLGVLSAWWNDKTKKTVFVVAACLMSAFAVIAIPTWSIYSLQRFNYPEHAVPIGKQIKIENAFVTLENDVISLDSLQGKTVVLYFWTASCGTCHAMMPDFSVFAESYANASDKVFYAVFLPNSKNDIEKEINHYEEITSKEYAFQWGMALDSEEVMEKLEFNGVPHLTIISTDGTVVYNGIVDFHWASAYHPRRYLNR
jgi:thiol-disulfide isomerase/thioredoxin